MGFSLSLFIFMPLLFLLLQLHLILALSSPFVQTLCHHDESSALLQFKESFIIQKSVVCDDYWVDCNCQKVASWKVEGNKSDCCSWDGVECDEGTGHVIGLDLSGSCLCGSINSSISLFRLVHLQSLNLAYNDFNYSQIPFEVGNLLRLTHLNLSNSWFSGQIPLGVLSHLSKLSSLDLSYNPDLYAESDLLRSLAQNFTSLEELLLSSVNISSVVPESLANLSSLTTLNLRICQLNGEFPTGIFQLPNLRNLNIGYNRNLTGQLPEFHSNSSLEVLLVWGTGFYGKLPTSIGSLRSLHVLSFAFCNFSGSIPPSLSNLTQLTYLDLSLNNLIGHIPSSLPSNMTQLTYLDLSNNYLEGTIPSSFSELKSIETLDLTNNNLSGMLELDMFLKIKSLKDLYLSSNTNLTLLTKANSNDTLAQFESLNLASCNLRKFPDFLRNQNKLRYLSLADNNLGGLIPKWFCNVSIEALLVISLSGNFLIGFEQSPVVLLWSELVSLDLGNNKLQGSLPIPPPSTMFYQVQRNFIREMSPLICNVSSLYTLDLSYNNLSGMLHPCLGNLSSSFIELQLRSNNFHGTIPKTWSKGSSLKMIDLSENQLQGQLPRSMANCTMLEYLNVCNNQINDTFPFWLGTLSRLKILNLHSNAFHGAIKSPEINYTFPELHIIDLSHNSFSGNLPAEYFLHWTAMKEVGADDQLIYMQGNSSESGWLNFFPYKVTMANKGITLEYEKIPDRLRAIDFSSNRFKGEISELVGSLKGLHLLNLSNNALTGHIPSSLENLTNIEAMDLSQNKLLGEIPPQLTQLFSLEYFDVSNNNLTGPIPHGNQFDTFQNSSFGDNPGLCGSPLSKKCGDFNYTPTPPPFEENQSSESPFEFGWKVVAIGYGCGFVIGLVIGKIVIARKYDWFVKIFGRM